jgi:hypothetical protein
MMCAVARILHAHHARQACRSPLLSEIAKEQPAVSDEAEAGSRTAQLLAQLRHMLISSIL